MEPRALVNAIGHPSTSAVFTEQMREDLINTPVRSFVARESEKGRDSLASAGDTEISSTYNSPTTTMNLRNPGVSTPTELVGWDPATSQTPGMTEEDKEAMGELETPYLMKQGRRVMNEGVMMSCPPKQSNRGLFERVDKGDRKMKVKLQEARRRTIRWKPKVSSPLKL